jgi:hypothetical protein
MIATLGEGRQAQEYRSIRVRSVLRVAGEDRYLGDVLLDANGRVWRHADTIPPDVVLKATLAHNRRGEVCGKLVGLKDGRSYSWFVVGALAEAAA